MPLKIHLKKGQQIIINGAVIENTGSNNVSLLLKNDASLLRDNDVLSPEDASTPAARTYYALQCLYLFPDDFTDNLRRFNEFLTDYVKAAPSAKPIGDELWRLVEKKELYKALKKAQELIAHESKVFAHVNEQLAEKLRDAPGSGEPEGG